MSSSVPPEQTPAVRARPPGRGTRRGLPVPLTAAGTGLVLVAVSAVLLLHHRSLPADFGAVPADDGTNRTAAASSTPAAVLPTTALPMPATATTAPVRTTTASSRPSTAAQPVVKTTASRDTRSPASTAAPPTTGPSTSTATPTPTARSTGAAPTRPVRTPTTVAAPPADTRELPRQLVLPRFGIRADVLTVTSTDGTLAVPDDPQQVGWWAGSALPGSAAGTSVLDGHIDSATAGVGALIHLSELAPGDRVEIVGASGRTLHYDVVARRVYAKHAGLPPSLFSADGAGRLLLISCGGPFNASTGSYEDNIVVFATPSAG